MFFFYVLSTNLKLLTMKNNYLLTKFFVLLSFFGIAQNRWQITPPLYFDTWNGFSFDLPVPPIIQSDPFDPDTYVTNDPTYPLDGYDGQRSQAASNMIGDRDGNIVFFVIDGIIYNKKGEARGYLPGVIDSYAQQEVYGSTEVLIVPDPTNCEKYYIFENDITEASSTGFVGSKPTITIYDAINETIVSNVRWHSQLSPALFNGSTMTDGAFGNLNGKWSQSGIGATKKQADNSYFVVNKLNNAFFVAKISTSGITGVSFHESNLGNGGNYNRCVVEIFEDPVTNEKLIATQHRGDENSILLLRYSPDMTTVISENRIGLGDFTTILSNKAFIKGLEFSKDGRYLMELMYLQSKDQNLSFTSIY